MPTTKPRLSPKQKRIAVLKDVLKTLRYYRQVRARSYYLGGFYELRLGPEDARRDAREVLPQIRKKCEVCALTACFLSYVNVFDRVTVGELGNPEFPEYFNSAKMFDVLGKLFSEHQLVLIESAFEGRYCRKGRFGSAPPDDPEVERAVTFGSVVASAPDRLRAIVKNALKNGGEFKP